MNNFPDDVSSGVAIAVLAENDFTLYDGIKQREAYQSIWTVLFVVSKWHQQLSSHLGLTEHNFNINSPEGDPQKTASYVKEAVLAAQTGQVLPAPQDSEEFLYVLNILTQLARGYLKDYANMANISYAEVIDRLQRGYLSVVASRLNQ